MPDQTITFPANIVDLTRALDAQGGRLSLAVARALAVAGSLDEWDSETIESVLTELQLALPVGVPEVGAAGVDGAALRFWAKIADEVGIEHPDYSEDDEQ